MGCYKRKTVLTSFYSTILYITSDKSCCLVSWSTTVGYCLVVTYSHTYIILELIKKRRFWTCAYRVSQLLLLLITKSKYHLHSVRMNLNLTYVFPTLRLPPKPELCHFKVKEHSHHYLDLYQLAFVF